jgi:hypothetical protein
MAEEICSPHALFERSTHHSVSTTPRIRGVVANVAKAHRTVNEKKEKGTMVPTILHGQGRF